MRATTQSLLEKLGRQRRTLSQHKFMSYARQIALGLNYLHTHTPVVIHRDLCPSNVLISADRESVKVRCSSWPVPFQHWSEILPQLAAHG